MSASKPPPPPPPKVAAAPPGQGSYPARPGVRLNVGGVRNPAPTPNDRFEGAAACLRSSPRAVDRLHVHDGRPQCTLVWRTFCAARRWRCPQAPTRRLSPRPTSASCAFARRRRSAAPALPLQDPDGAQTFRMLASHCLGSNWRGMKPDEAAKTQDGREHFIDVDPAVFAVILNYLRTRAHPAPRRAVLRRPAPRRGSEPCERAPSAGEVPEADAELLENVRRQATRPARPARPARAPPPHVVEKLTVHWSKLVTGRAWRACGARERAVDAAGAPAPLRPAPPPPLPAQRPCMLPRRAPRRASADAARRGQRVGVSCDFTRKEIHALVATAVSESGPKARLFAPPRTSPPPPAPCRTADLSWSICVCTRAAARARATRRSRKSPNFLAPRRARGCDSEAGPSG